MANWKNNIRISDLHRAYEDKTMTIREIGCEVAKRLKVLPMDIQDIHFEKIVAKFEVVNSAEKYDRALNHLYDWGNFDNRLWVEAI